MHIAPLKTEFTRHIDTDAGNAGINATVKAKRKKPSQEKSEQECKTQNVYMNKYKRNYIKALQLKRIKISCSFSYVTN